MRNPTDAAFPDHSWGGTLASFLPLSSDDDRLCQEDDAVADANPSGIATRRPSHSSAAISPIARSTSVSS